MASASREHVALFSASRGFELLAKGARLAGNQRKASAKAVALVAIAKVLDSFARRGGPSG